MRSGQFSVKQLCVISIIACIEAVVFTSFSQLLYLEAITLTVLMFAVVFDKRISLMGALVYGLVNMVINGITPWTFMYFLIYPCYTLIVIAMKPVLKDCILGYSVLCGVLSFMTGQFLQLPYLLFSEKVTAFYLLAGLKTSVIQAGLSAVSCFVLFQPLRVVLEKIERRLNV